MFVYQILFVLLIHVICFTYSGFTDNNIEGYSLANVTNGRRSKHGLRIKDPAPNQHRYVEKPLRIRGGFLPDTLNFPYIAAVIINGRLWCAGTLVDVNWVLTAAHCLNYVLQVAPMKNLRNHVVVRLGSSHAYRDGALFNVIGVIRHPKFEEEPVPHADIALLKLTRNVELSGSINILEIFDGMNQPFAASFITVAGWGAVEGSQNAWIAKTPDLMAGRLKVRSHQFCEDSYQLVNGFQFTNDFFCASLRNGTRDVCLFDAGAPAVQHNKLMGVMSFGPEHCGHKFHPAVFIKAFYFKDFVKSTISTYKTDLEVMEAMKIVNPLMSKERVVLDDHDSSAVKDDLDFAVDDEHQPQLKDLERMANLYG